jgi:folylpolyglutamate synthase/dihydropteroate synthase
MSKTKRNLSDEAKNALCRKIETIIQEKEKQKYEEEVKLFKKDNLSKKLNEISKKVQQIDLQRMKLIDEFRQIEEEVKIKYKNMGLINFNRPYYNGSYDLRNIRDEITLCTEFGEVTPEDLINSIVEKLINK